MTDSVSVTPSLSIVFAGTPEFSVPALEALVASGQRISAVYTQPDRPAGRGQKITMSAVKQAALKHGLAIEQPASLRVEENVERLRGFRPDLMVVVAYGLILPQTVLDIPRLGCVNIHASLLPRWRGAAPIHRAIQAGDTETGVTIMRMEAGLDTGPMLLEVREPIRTDDTTASLHDRLASQGAHALLAALPKIADGTIVPRPQPVEGVTYASKIAKEEARIDWSRSAAEIDRQVRAFNPWPVAETQLNGSQLRVWEAHSAGQESDGQESKCSGRRSAGGAVPESTNAHPGTVIAVDARGIHVATGHGVLTLARVQLAGRKPTSALDFTRGQAIDGLVLGA